MMKRVKHRVKVEKPESSTSYPKTQEDYDLTYFIHDRVELMHQVFSVIKSKELKALAPECVRHISIDDLQELCTEELLGISSKRLCAILDGAEPPSDTDTSSQSDSAQLETISLDSISSDEEILSQTSSKKHKKHKRRPSKSKRHKRHHPEPESSPTHPTPATHPTHRSHASRAGLTVLELLELQARARAIRAQLHNDQAIKAQSQTIEDSATDNDDDVLIKEEPADVVLISSDEEKPTPPAKSQENKETEPKTNTVTKRVSNMIITAPQTKPSRKIKLNRNTFTVSVANTKNNDPVPENSKTEEAPKNVPEITKKNTQEDKPKERAKKKIKKKSKKTTVGKDDSDDDEITLQLSDTEKLDLLEDLDRKTFEKLSSSEDSESSSSDTSNSDDSITEEALSKKKAIISRNKKLQRPISEESIGNIDPVNNSNKEITKATKSIEKSKSSDKSAVDTSNENITKASISNQQSNLSKTKNVNDKDDVRNEIPKIQSDDVIKEITEESLKDIESAEQNKSNTVSDNPIQSGSSQNGTNVSENEKIVTDNVPDNSIEKNIEISNICDIPIVSDKIETEVFLEDKVDQNKSNELTQIDQNLKEKDDSDQKSINESLNTESIKEPSSKTAKKAENKKTDDKELSEGELSDRASSEVEAYDLKPEVVCLSDEDLAPKSKESKKKKKKDKKIKKEKKSKKSKSDFRKGDDENFYKDTTEVVNNKPSVISPNDAEDVYEILELSDDSSCYEVNGAVLSKEPTTEEIAALSAKIDEIEREDVITEEEIKALETMQKNDEENVENISWKDRYLDSKKVKTVLSTSSIFNALRKKNIELKKKLEESKLVEQIKEKVISEEIVKVYTEKPAEFEEGTIEHFNTLPGSSKYVDPVKEAREELEPQTEEHDRKIENKEKTNNDTENKEESKEKETAVSSQVTREMKKDAKKLLKMYKKLLKYNDISKQKDPNKKKKKKSKKSVNDSVASK